MQLKFVTIFLIDRRVIRLGYKWIIFKHKLNLSLNRNYDEVILEHTIICSACSNHHKLVIAPIASNSDSKRENMHAGNKQTSIGTLVPAADQKRKQSFCLVYTCPKQNRAQKYEFQLDVERKISLQLGIEKVEDIPSSSSTQGYSRELGPEGESLLDYGKKIFKDSGDTVKTFITFMVPLTTALITAYMALLKLMGIENISNVQNGSPEAIVYPPMLFLLSLVFFIAANFPFAGIVNLQDLKSVYRHRIRSIRWKYIGSLIGALFFLIGVLLMILVILPFIGWNKVT
jgi:hypothetical protein